MKKSSLIILFLVLFGLQTTYTNTNNQCSIIEGKKYNNTLLSKYSPDSKQFIFKAENN